MGFCLDQSVITVSSSIGLLRPQLVNFINIRNTIQIASSLFLLVFSVALAGISLLGEVIRVRTGDNQRSGGVVIARCRSFGALDHQRRDLHFNRLIFRKIGPKLLYHVVS